MEEVNTIIIGAGVAGLAIAAELSDRDIDTVLVERHDGFGRECSSRNSEVIHAGIYYTPGSLKASLCVEGRKLLCTLCREHGIPHRKTGKLIIARNREELPLLEKLETRGRENGVAGLELLSKQEALRCEPALRAEGALLSRETGIIDSHSLMAFLERKASRTCTIAYNCEVVGLEQRTSGYIAHIHDADGGSYTLGSRTVINAAGLGAERIARLVGINTGKAGYTIHPCKGEYFRVRGGVKTALSHLVYPPPSPVSLGIHTVIDLQGGLKLGPNAFYVDEIDYSVDETHRESFLESVQKYLPSLNEEDLTPDMAGIRPKLYRRGEPERDFVIRHEADKGFPGLINCIGIESPGLTAALAIARLAGRIIDGDRARRGGRRRGS